MDCAQKEKEATETKEKHKEDLKAKKEGGAAMEAANSALLQ